MKGGVSLPPYAGKMGGSSYVGDRGARQHVKAQEFKSIIE